MDTLLTLALLLRDLGFLLYGGPLVAFAILLLVVERVPGIAPWELVRSWRAWGPGLGLALGATVLGALSAHWLRRGAFSWGGDSLGQQLELAAWLAFFLLWLSNIKLEIWTLEPLRRLDRAGALEDPDAYRAALPPVRLHLALHAGLVLIVVVLSRLAESAAGG